MVFSLADSQISYMNTPCMNLFLDAMKQNIHTDRTNVEADRTSLYDAQHYVLDTKWIPSFSLALPHDPRGLERRLRLQVVGHCPSKIPW
jgi:hypothetical protein